VIALVGGLALIAAFFMPWFASQGLLLSGQFLNDFLASASAADLQRFVPGTSPTEARLLRVLVDLFAGCGAVAAGLCLAASIPGLRGARLLLISLLILSGLIPLVAWGGGITRLPPGSSFQVGLWLIAIGAIAILVGAALELIAYGRNASGPRVSD
jgi:hypothetical protein